MVELLSELVRGGGLDSEDVYEPSFDDRLESRAQDVFSELESRQEAAGGVYPFAVDGGSIHFLAGVDGTVYLFLLALSCLGKDGARGLRSGAEVFEDLCAAAARSYLGGESVRFGAPRRTILSRGFRDALDEVCAKPYLNEGGPAHRKGNARAKDGGLDVLAWRHFPDRRPGKVILMGQCATGQSEVGRKLLAVDERSFQDQFLQRSWESRPLKAFFIPWSQPNADQWSSWSRQGGILFDRCRVAHHAAKDLPAELLEECRRWASGNPERS